MLPGIRKTLPDLGIRSGAESRSNWNREAQIIEEPCAALSTFGKLRRLPLARGLGLCGGDHTAQLSFPGGRYKLWWFPGQLQGAAGPASTASSKSSS
jgi:hypothetical protein